MLILQRTNDFSEKVRKSSKSKQANKRANNQTTKQPNSQTAKQPNSQTIKQPNKQTNDQASTQTHIQINKFLSMFKSFSHEFSDIRLFIRSYHGDTRGF